MEKIKMSKKINSYSNRVIIYDYRACMKNKYIYVKEKMGDRYAMAYIYDYTAFVTLESNYDVWDRFNHLEWFTTDYEYYMLDDTERRMFLI